MPPQNLLPFLYEKIVENSAIFRQMPQKRAATNMIGFFFCIWISFWRNKI